MDQGTSLLSFGLIGPGIKKKWRAVVIIGKREKKKGKEGEKKEEKRNIMSPSPRGETKALMQSVVQNSKEFAR